MRNCVICNKQHYSVNGRETCSVCTPLSAREKKPNCQKCGRSCLGIDGVALCGTCRFLDRYQKEHIPEARFCEKCHRILRTKKTFITHCTRKDCGGTNDYYKTIRKHINTTLDTQEQVI